MGNPYRGEVTLNVDGEPRVMRLTLGALATLEARLECGSMMDMIGRFENGAFKVRDIISLLAAGLNGGGWAVTEAQLMQTQIDGGPMRAAEAAGALLRVTFTLPDEDASQ